MYGRVSIIYITPPLNRAYRGEAESRMSILFIFIGLITSVITSCWIFTSLSAPMWVWICYIIAIISTMLGGIFTKT